MKLLNRWKLLVGLACSSFLLSLGMMPVATEVSDPSVDVRTASLLSSTQPLIATHINIEELRVGQRVLTGLASDELGETQVDSGTWKKLTLTADWTWSGGTLDTFHIQTLQSPEWMQATNAQLGSRVPMPLDVREMGCPENLFATVDRIEPCPEIQHSPGRVILTTVNHLNPACRTLEVRAEDGTTEKIHTTDFHPFWSETKQDWVKAYRLAVGEKLSGAGNRLLTVTASSRLPGIHAVYNFTVETDHVYRVGKSNALVHNTDCSAPGKTILEHGTDLNSANEMAINGLNVEKARELGGGDYFWSTKNSEISDFFAKANPAGGDPAVLRIEVDNRAIKSLIRQDLLKVDEDTYRFSQEAWEMLNENATFLVKGS